MPKLVAALLLLAVSASANAITIVTPNGLDATAGGARNCIPTTGCLSARRYQQVFNSSEFSALSGPMLITSMSFRRDDLQFGGGAAAFSHQFSNIGISFSTTTRNAGNLSTSFDTNRGADLITAHSGALTVSSASSGFGSAQPFDVLITFANAFLYDPAAGNLLWEWQNFGGESFNGGVLDAITAADGSSRSLSTANDPNAATATQVNSTALIVQFDFASPVPEPTTVGLMLVGLAGAMRRKLLP